MAGILSLGSEVVQTMAADYLNLADVTNLARTCHRLRSTFSYYHHVSMATPAVTGPNIIVPSVTFAPIPSPLSSGTEDDMHPSTDSSPEEDDWEFEVTPEARRRLSLLPERDAAPTITLLPTELQLEVFSHLDLIDSTCLGLSSPNLYVVHRAIHGTKIALNTRRVGPNSLESAWEAVGYQECKQCGVYRCELHQHIKTWMPKELEYCSMKQNFGLPAKDCKHETCFRGKPSKPKRCGRHPLRTTSVHQDDASFNIPQ